MYDKIMKNNINMLGPRIINLHNYGRIDSDRARDLDTRRSGSTCASFGNGALLAWKSKLQPTVVTSSIKAEYLTLPFGTCEIIWLNMI